MSSQPRFTFAEDVFDPTYLVVAPSKDLAAKETSAIAAVQAQPKRLSKNAQLMILMRAAGEVGLSDPEIQQRTGWERHVIPLRRFDCRSQLEVAPTRDVQHGQPYTRWRVKA